jgi:hypothetical protein
MPEKRDQPLAHRDCLRKRGLKYGYDGSKGQGTMKKGIVKAGCCYLSVALSLAALVSCAREPDVTGRWQEIGKRSTIVFRTDGSFHTVDDMGMAASGKYALQEDGRIRFEIMREGSPPEILEGRFARRGKELILNYTRPEETERYRRLTR